MTHRTTLLINDSWTFDFGEHPGHESDESASAQWYDVGLPHSFSIPDFREAEFYVGYGCYRRNLDVPVEWIGRSIGLEFLGVFQVAEVYVNGILAGHHSGGYTGFVVDISQAVTVGANDVFVRVNNLWNPQVAPRAGDYSFSGGIYRDVSVVVTDPVHLAWNGTFVRTPVVDSRLAELAVTTEVQNDLDTVATVDVIATVRRGTEVVTSFRSSAAIAAGTTLAVEQLGVIHDPMLWHPDSPHLYELVTTLERDGRVVDEVVTSFGVRWFEFTADRGFFLNGEHFDLHGVNVHQNHGGWADAVTHAGIRRDVTLVKEAGFNTIRGSHYPHHPFFSGECDRQGILFWSELCFWGIGGENVEGYWFASAYPVDEGDQSAFDSSCLETLEEMIRQNRNHASIFTWSVGNEVFFSDDHVVGKAKMLTRRLVERAHELDPTRAAAVGGAQRKAFDRLGDVAGYNGDGAAIFVDPGVPNVVAEYHGNAGERPGEYETTFAYGVDEHFAWRSGKILWCAFHYKTIVPTGGLNGIVDYWRVPRRAWHWYRHELRGITPPGFPRPGSPHSLQLVVDRATIGTDGTDDAQLRVLALGTGGERVSAAFAVELEVIDGPAMLPGGRTLVLSPETASFLDGEGAVELRSYFGGTSTIVARADGVGEARTTIQSIGHREWGEGRIVRHLPPAPSVFAPPQGAGDVSLAAYRPVSTSSFHHGHEGSNATERGTGGYWRAATQGHGEWIEATLEFAYPVRQVAVVFATEPDAPWVVETTADHQEFTIVARGGASPDQLAYQFEFDTRLARAVRITFPEKPIDVEEIRVY